MKYWKSLCLAIIFIIGNSITLSAQNNGINKDSIFFKQIFEEELLKGHSYARLGELCKQIGARLSGSDAAEKGIQWATNMLKSYQFDAVDTQLVMVPRWERGNIEKFQMKSPVLDKMLKNSIERVNVIKRISSLAFPNSPNAYYECENYISTIKKISKYYSLPACALGGSIGGKVESKVIAVNSKTQLDSLGKIGQLNGKIVLLNRPMEESMLNTFNAYGGCVNQRVNGAVWCAPYGALAVLVRSVSNKCDIHPHTGVTHYEDKIAKIPIAAVATAVADVIAYLSVNDPDFTLQIELDCRILADRPSANVLAETKGNQFPEKIIVFGGHFDSWDQGEGAHDDGAGCMHAFEALRLLKVLGYKPKHTLRCVFWINEENGLRGGTEYARLSKVNNENHIVAIESDRGGFVPRGFGVDSSILSNVLKFQKLLNDYGIGKIEKGGGGADIGPLKTVNKNTSFVSFIPDSQRYFDVHHAETDVFESVNKRELEMGAAALAAMIYILDQELN